MTAKRQHRPYRPAKAPATPHYTAAQNKSFRIYLRRHPSTPASRQTARVQSRVQARQNARIAARKRAAPGLALGADWIIGGNDEMPSCVATAVANSLLAVTGIRVSDQDVLELHELAGGGDGVSISDTLAALAGHGIGGHRAAGCYPVEALFPGAIVGMSDGLNDHAVTSTRQGALISWGAPLGQQEEMLWQLDGEIWYIDWHTTPGG